jgi:hypothetical protein
VFHIAHAKNNTTGEPAGDAAPRVHAFRRLIAVIRELRAESQTVCTDLDEHWAQGQFRNQRMCM